MGRYDSHINPFQYHMNTWNLRRVVNELEQLPKSIPAVIKKIEKDFVHVAFETKNSIFTMPIVKMTQSFSRFGREATQVGDRGLSVFGGYYLGGTTAFAGGNTNFYPRANLSTLSFQPLANLDAPKRNYNQHWETGGPDGWRVKVTEEQQKEKKQNEPLVAQNPEFSQPTLARLGGPPRVQRARMRVIQQRMPIGFRALPRVATPRAIDPSQTSQTDQAQQQQQQKKKDYTEFSFNKDGRIVAQSVDQNNYMSINQKDKEVMLTGAGSTQVHGKDVAYVTSQKLVIINPEGESKESGAGWDSEQEKEVTAGGGGGGGGSEGKVYHGGDPKKHQFAKIMTEGGVSKNVFARIA